MVREGFGAKEARGAKRAWCKESVVQGEQRDLYESGAAWPWCKASVVQGERGGETSACSACVHCAVGVVVGQGQRPRVALVGVVGVVREGFGAKEARGAKRAGCEESVVRGESVARR